MSRHWMEEAIEQNRKFAKEVGELMVDFEESKRKRKVSKIVKEARKIIECAREQGRPGEWLNSKDLLVESILELVDENI